MESVTADLVCIGRADTLKGRTDLALSGGSLVSGIEKSVGRKDKMSLLGYHQFLLRIDIHLGYIAALLLESNRIENDTATDDIDGTFAENT